MPPKPQRASGVLPEDHSAEIWVKWICRRLFGSTLDGRLEARESRIVGVPDAAPVKGGAQTGEIRPLDAWHADCLWSGVTHFSVHIPVHPWFTGAYEIVAMRITGGQAARRHLSVPKGMDVRPTPDRVKRAIFNSLGDRVLEARVLELFAGSGALSLECLSRGAKSAVCVEKSFKHGEFIRRNAAAAGLSGPSLQVRVQDVFPSVRQMASVGTAFDLIFADPPYGQKNVGKRSESLAQQTLDEPDLVRLLVPGGLLVLGHARRDTLTVPQHWVEKRSLKHGDNVMRFLVPAAHGFG